MKTLLSVAVALSLSASALARAGSLVDMKIIDRDTGAAAALTPHYNDGKYYVAGVPGHRYGVQIRNRTGARVLAVISVDGVNAVTGATAGPDQDGYVLDPHQFTEIDGWRKSMSEVADFNFTALSNSYASRTGRPDNVGVIGVAVFREKVPVWRERTDKIAAGTAYSEPARDSAMRNSAPAPAAAPPASAMGSADREVAQAGAAKSQVDARRAENVAAKPVMEESLGTGHGAREESLITYTHFDRESSQPNEVDSVWYDSYNNLVARGIIDVVPRHEPQPFPHSFVPDPAG